MLNAIVFCAVMFQGQPVYMKGIIVTTSRLERDTITPNLYKNSYAVNFGNEIKIMADNDCLYIKPDTDNVIDLIKNREIAVDE